MPMIHARPARSAVPSRLLALAAVSAALAACSGGGASLSRQGPSTASARIVDLPAGPVAGSAAVVEARLRAAGVTVTAIDRQSGFIKARSRDNRFVDCGTLRERVNGRTNTYNGNAPRVVVVDPGSPGTTQVREVDVVTSAGIGITPGVTNTVVVNQEHQVTIRLFSADRRTLLGSETLAFTDRGFARFEDGTVCRSSDAMNQALL